MRDLVLLSLLFVANTCMEEAVATTATPPLHVLSLSRTCNCKASSSLDVLSFLRLKRSPVAPTSFVSLKSLRILSVLLTFASAWTPVPLITTKCGTSNLRGAFIVELTVQFGKSGYHSGEVGGIIPETFRIIRSLLDRLDDSATGRVVDDFQVEIPQWAKDEAHHMASLSGPEMHAKYDYHQGCLPMQHDDLPEMYLNNTWRANLSITGAAGLPDTGIAGNVVRASTSLKLSMRLPPSGNPAEAEAKLI